MKKLILFITVLFILVPISVSAIDFDKQWDTFNEKDWMEKLLDPGYIPWEDLEYYTPKYERDETLVTGIFRKKVSDTEFIATYAFSDPSFPDSNNKDESEVAYFLVRILGVDPYPKAFKDGTVFDVFGRVKGKECDSFLPDFETCLTVISATDFYNIPSE